MSVRERTALTPAVPDRDELKVALFKLHFSIVLAGFTGIFGKLITLNDGLLVWWRVAFACALMVPYLKIMLSKSGRRPRLWHSEAGLWRVIGVGSLQTLHWVLFYASIRASNVSVALVCISLMGFFSAIFSPLIMKTRWSGREFLFSGITILGIALIFHFDTQYRLGIAIGVVSSAVASLFVVCNKKISGRQRPDLLFFQEMGGGLCMLTVLMPLYLTVFPSSSLLPTGMDVFWLVLLSLFGTVVLYVFQLQALQKVSAFTVNLSLNLEPIYAVILAAVFLGEAREYTTSFYLGLGLILLSVALQTLVVWRGGDETASIS